MKKKVKTKIYRKRLILELASMAVAWRKYDLGEVNTLKFLIGGLKKGDFGS